MKLRIATYNTHKGFSHFNQRMMVHELHLHLQALYAEIVFLQEVQGENPHLALRVLCLENISNHAAMRRSLNCYETPIY